MPAAVGAVVYGGAVLFVASLLLFVVLYFWSDRFGVPAGSWSADAVWRPVLVNVLLFSAFALHHSLFARTGLKQWVMGLASERLERSVYVWFASIAFAAVCLLWQPVPGAMWATAGIPAAALVAAQLGGIAISLIGAARIGGLSLAGIAQGAGDRPSSPPALSRNGLYGLVRHPIYLGWVLIVWATPVMTGTRLVFAAVSTAYLVAAIPFEERDLRRTFGPAYADYARHVRWRMLPFVY